MKTWKVLLIAVSLAAGCSSSAPPAESTKSSAPSPATSAKAPNEGAALDAIMQTTEAQATYFKVNRRYALTYDELVEAHLMKAEPSSSDTGYDFTIRPAADAQTYRLLVVPQGSTSARHFFADQTGAIRAETGKDATADSPKI